MFEHVRIKPSIKMENSRRINSGHKNDTRSNGLMQKGMDSANPIAQHKDYQQNGLDDLKKLFSKFNPHQTLAATKKRNETSTRRRSSYSYSSSRVVSGYSPSSTNSSPILNASNASPILYSSTHSSPILHTSRTPSPAHGAPASLNPCPAYAPTSVCNGVQKAAVPNGQINLKSMRDPLTNKITIKSVAFKKDKESVSNQGKSVIAKTPITSHVPRTEATSSGISQSKTETQPSVPFSLPPLSVRSTDNRCDENLPDLLKPKNLEKYIKESAPKKMKNPENGHRVNALRDHDYCLSQNNQSEKRQKFIRKKKTSPIRDNLQVVDMECSDIEDEGTIIVDNIIVDEKKPEESAVEEEEPCKKAETAETAHDMIMCYARDEYNNELKFIDEAAELLYSYESAPECTMCSATKKLMENNLGDVLDATTLELENWCSLGCIHSDGPGCISLLKEMENLAKSVPPDGECSAISHLLENLKEGENKMEPTIDSATLDNIKLDDITALINGQDPEFSSVSSLDLEVQKETVYVDPLDVKEEVVEAAASEVEIQMEKQTLAKLANQFITVESSDPFLSTTAANLPRPRRCESKENMVDKVPSYIFNSTKSSIKKNVLQRHNVEQDTGAASDSLGETNKKLPLSSEHEKSNRCSSSPNENVASSTLEFSVSRRRTRSPSPDRSRSYSSHFLSLENHHRKSDRQRHYKRSWSRSRSRSRSPISRGSAHSSRYQTKTKENENDEQRRVVFVGKLPNNYTERQLKDTFSMYGEIEKVSLHFRTGKDNYGFITFKDKRDANRCLDAAKEETGFRFELCFGGRRDFCKVAYADLDGMTEEREEWGQIVYRNDDVPFEQLLKQYSRDRKK